ncbi:hypothetical protein ACFQ1R_11060 [Mariniflexile jejuense]|uniref:Por secretion system C-terminal sorting domain-containing protein n=1 Tax=Mariniflexile jejuense TaxID=1173582 RepID=A0ABW3JJF2_9FLAO
MKNVLNNSKKGFLMVTMFATLLSFANEASFYTFKSDAKRTSLTLNNVKQGDKFSIKDENGIVLYTEEIQKSGIYSKGFNFTSLPNGDYVFELDKDLETNTIPFTVKSNAVFVNKDLETTTFKPYVKQKNNMLFISKLAPNLETMKISIYADNNSEFELLYSEKVEGIKAIEKVYKLEKGNYKVTISSNNKEYTTFINN